MILVGVAPHEAYYWNGCFWVRHSVSLLMDGLTVESMFAQKVKQIRSLAIYVMEVSVYCEASVIPAELFELLM